MNLFNLLEGETPESGAGSIILLLVFVVAIIGLFIWQTISGKKKQKEAQEMVNQLKIGDRVKTIGGICGFVVQINDAENTFVLETGLEGNKSYVKFDKGAIYQTAPAQGSEVVTDPKLTAKPEEKKETKPATAKKSSTAKKPSAKKEQTEKTDK